MKTAIKVWAVSVGLVSLWGVWGDPFLPVQAKAFISLLIPVPVVAAFAALKEA